jgi:PAS domain S-box-containing protein
VTKSEVRAHALLDRWREAERRWEATPSDDPGFEAARTDVLRAWLAYQAAAVSDDPNAIVLVADNAMRYVAANAAACRHLGYAEEEITGMAVPDLTVSANQEKAVELWREFRLAGRQEGEYILRAKDGSSLGARYLARAHFPVADLHTSRLELIEVSPPGD